jgi:hypothetical protein
MRGLDRVSDTYFRNSGGEGKAMDIYSAQDLKSQIFDNHTSPCKFHGGGIQANVSSWSDLSTVFLRWLLEQGHLCVHKLPVPNHADHGKYLINSQPHHKHPHDGNWKKIGAYYVDTKYNADAHRKNMLAALKFLDISDPDFRVSFRRQ